MKKLAAIIVLISLALCLVGCQEQASSDPLVAKWALKYNDGKSQIFFSFEDIGDLEVVKWEFNEASQELEQTEKHVGAYSADSAAGVITYDLEGETYVFGYSVEDKKALTLNFDEKTLVVPFIAANSAK